LQSNKQVKAIVGHTDAITSLIFLQTQTHKANPNSQNILMSGGHDGAIRAWDLRTFQCIYDVPAHRRKFDEGVLALASSDKYPLIVSGGADSIIKVLHE